MSSDRELIHRKKRFSYERSSRKFTAATPYLWRQETPKRSSSRSRTPATKQIKKMKKPIKIRHSRNFKSSKKEYELSKVNQVVANRPDSPHNTTQYIIGANNNGTETINLYKPHDQFAFDFQHHAMAGSMMGMMMNRFTQMQEQFTSPTTTAATGEDHSVDLQEEDHQANNGNQTPKSDSKLWDEQVEEADLIFDKNACDSYFEEVETKEDLRGLVKHLVNVLEQKDKEISDLKQKMQLHLAADVTKR